MTINHLPNPDDLAFELSFHQGTKGDWRYGERWIEARNILRTTHNLDFSSLHGKTAVDLGSGPRTMLEWFEGCHIVCIDPLLSNYLKLDKSKLDHPQITQRHSTFAETFISDIAGKADFIWTQNVLDHCHNWKNVVENMAKYLKDGGQFYLSTDAGKPPAVGHPGIASVAELIRTVESVGLWISSFRIRLPNESPFIRTVTLQGKKPRDRHEREVLRSMHGFSDYTNAKDQVSAPSDTTPPWHVHVETTNSGHAIDTSSTLVPIELHPEDRKYSELYRTGYGPGPVHELFNWCRDCGIGFEAKSLVDCGCGHAVIRELAKFERYLGVDISSEQIERLNRSKREKEDFRHGDLSQIKLGNDEFELAWSCDVLEHLTEAEALEAIASMFTFGRRVIVSVSCRSSRILSRKGENLHRCVHEPSWWKQRLSQHGQIEHERIQEDEAFFVLKPRRLG